MRLGKTTWSKHSMKCNDKVYVPFRWLMRSWHVHAQYIYTTYINIAPYACTFISARLGGMILASSTLTSPSGILLRHWRMMWRLCRISSTRHRYLVREDEWRKEKCVSVKEWQMYTLCEYECLKVSGETRELQCDLVLKSWFHAG